MRWEVFSPKDQHWYYVVNTPIRHPDGTMSKMAMIQDITDRKQLEQALKEAEAKYRGIFENAVIGIYQSTPEGRLLSVNPAMAAMFGYDSPEDMITAVLDLGHQVFVNPEDRKDLVREIEEAGVIRGRRCEMRRQDGGAFWISLDARAVRNEHGVIAYYEGFVQNIRAPKKAK